MKREAKISACGQYRWWLRRQWGEGLTTVVIMLNPSTADAERDDPTITRLMAWHRVWGYDGFLVVNLLPYRTSKPKDAIAWSRTVQQNWQAPPEGAFGAIVKNDFVISEACRGARCAIVAWGALPNELSVYADAALGIAMSTIGERIFCLGRTKAGYPIHPMARGKFRVPNDVALQRYVA